ncbi:MAG: penicillin-binding protein 2 [Acidobacteria bacterium]|nr:MAG: penicillin-binding protein 2 [Acidobacteriota bacterium]
MPKPRSRKRTEKSPMRSVFVRYMFIVAFLIIWIGIIGARLVHLQITQHDWLKSQAESTRGYEHKSKMLRGTIYERDGGVLAMSIQARSLFADPKFIEDEKSVSEKLAKVLDLDRKALAADLKEGRENGRRFIWIARKVSDEVFRAVNKAFSDSGDEAATTVGHPGLGWRKEQRREYPHNELAAHVIGFSNSNDEGQSGVERSQEDVLKGETVSKWRERDRLGRVYIETGTEREPPKDIVLTIDSTIQFDTEMALAKGVKDANAIAGKAVVLDHKTGEILAMANYPTFDPNRYSESDPETRRNRVIEDNFSPGSVMKMVTYGAALEERKISPEAFVNCGNGRLTVGGYTFSDSHAIGSVSYTEAFAQSSNVGAIRTGQSVGQDTFYKYVTEFGFGSRTGVELPAETEGQLSHPDAWGGMSLASMSIGYEIGVTSLQTAVAFATIANDGVKVQPHVLKEIRQSDGSTVSTVKPKAERVVSIETARNLRKMLREVVLNGTAKQAQLQGYSSAGKTGTAWKYDPQLRRVNRAKYISSFVGFAPADDPRVAIAITIDEPRGGLRYGGQVAAPVFRQIAEKVLPRWGVPPDGSIPEDIPLFDDPAEEPMLAVEESEEDAADPAEAETRKETSVPEPRKKEAEALKKEDLDPENVAGDRPKAIRPAEKKKT